VTSRTELAARRLGEIARGAGPGGRLGTKAELRQRCEVSVGTFYEALRLAQARGLVAVRPGPGGGLFAAEQSPLVRLGNALLGLDTEATAVADAVRVRDALEPLVITDAARHSSPSDIARYREQVDAMAEAAKAEDAAAFMRANWQLHALMAAANPSALLRSIYEALLATIRDHTTDIRPVEGSTLADVSWARLRIHAGLVDAIAEDDPEELRRLIAQHGAPH
jgi:DNA-binding FadR family transcriptional regulator